MSLHARVHHVLLDKPFRIDFEAHYGDHATMDLVIYIEAIKTFYNLTVSSLPSQRKHQAKREWWELKQGESESLAEYRQRHNYDSVMPPEQLLIKVSARLIDFCPTSTTEY